MGTQVIEIKGVFNNKSCVIDYTRNGNIYT